MEHGSYVVDILDETGKIIGHKPRKEIDKSRDIYKTAHILLITPDGQAVLTRIKRRDDELPNLYYDHYGATVATIIRSGEIAEEAARRAVSRELFIDNAELHFVGEDFENPPDNKKGFVAFFYLISDPPHIFSKTDINQLTPLAPSKVSRQIVEQPDEFAPTFRLLWEKYRHELPL